MKSQAFKQEYAELKAPQVQDFAAVQTHFKQAKRLRKECKDRAEDHRFGMLAEDAAQDGMTKNMLNLENAIHRNETANAGTVTVKKNAVLQEQRDGMALLQQQMALQQQ